MKKISVDQRIQQTVLYYESIIAKMPGHVYWLDDQGFALGCNENVLNMFGFKSVAEFKGLSFEEMGQICNWSFETVKLFKNDSSEVLHTGQAKLNIEEPPIANREGKLFYFLTSRVPILESNNKVIGVIGISIDITERKKLEKNLVIAKDKAEAANKAKTEFIMNMSHDLRTPLSGIIGLSSIQADDATSTKEQQYGEWIHSAGEQLLELLNSVIEVTVVEHQIEKVKLEKINLQQFAEEIHALMQPAIAVKGLEFQIKADIHLPIVITDRIKLKRIILNLLSNAVKFTKKGKVSLEINLISVEEDRAKIEISVTDTGIGISKDDLDKIFDRFYRAHPSYKAEYTGYGIGLFLVKKAVELLGGKIKVSSEEDKGSCFTLEFNFPLAEENIEQTLSATSQQSLSQTEADKRTRSVLIAEDNTLVLHVVKKLLVNLGYEVITVTDGNAALDALQTQCFNWALLDIGLPILVGTEVAKRYRQWEKEHNKPRLPLFALTAHAVDEIKEKCEEVGIDYILNKPFTDKDVQIIKLFMENKE